MTRMGGRAASRAVSLIREIRVIRGSIQLTIIHAVVGYAIRQKRQIALKKR